MMSANSTQSSRSDLVGNIMAAMSAAQVASTSRAPETTEKSSIIPEMSDSSNKSGNVKDTHNEGKPKNREAKDIPQKRKNSNARKASGTSEKSSHIMEPSKSDSCELDDIKRTLATLTASMSTLTPVVMQLKTAYDMYASECEANEDYVINEADLAPSDEGQLSEDDSTAPPPAKQPKITALSHLDSSVKRPDNSGPPITPQLATLVQSLLQQGMDSDVKEAMLLKHVKPSNCPRLDVVRVNPEIYNSVRRTTKQQDCVFQKLQQPLIAGITAVTEVLNAFVQAEMGEGSAPTAEHVMTGLSDAVSLLCDSCHGLDVRRRVGFKQDMREEFRSLCSNSAPVTALLFGDELSESVKALSETTKVTKQIIGTYSLPKPSRPVYNLQRQTPRRPPFLGFSPRGRGFSRPHQTFRRQEQQRTKPQSKWAGQRKSQGNAQQ